MTIIKQYKIIIIIIPHSRHKIIQRIIIVRQRATVQQPAVILPTIIATVPTTVPLLCIRTQLPHCTATAAIIIPILFIRTTTNLSITWITMQLMRPSTIQRRSVRAQTRHRSIIKWLTTTPTSLPILQLIRSLQRRQQQLRPQPQRHPLKWISICSMGWVGIMCKRHHLGNYNSNWAAIMMTLYSVTF